MQKKAKAKEPVAKAVPPRRGEIVSVRTGSSPLRTFRVYEEYHYPYEIQNKSDAIHVPSRRPFAVALPKRKLAVIEIIRDADIVAAHCHSAVAFKPKKLR